MWYIYIKFIHMIFLIYRILYCLGSFGQAPSASGILQAWCLLEPFAFDNTDFIWLFVLHAASFIHCWREYATRELVFSRSMLFLQLLHWLVLLMSSFSQNFARCGLPASLYSCFLYPYFKLLAAVSLPTFDAF